MASRKDLVTLICERQEKQPFASAETSLLAQILFDVNRGIRYAYNNGSLSFKTRILQGYTYTVGGVNPIPTDFLSFQDTGKVYDVTVPQQPRELKYRPWHVMMDYIIGRKKIQRGIPRVYGYGGPSAQDTNRRDLVLGPTPATPTVTLDLAYQATPQPDGVLDNETVDDPTAWNIEITPIPATWHTTLLLDLIIVFRKMDKGLSLADQNALIAESFRQMNVQEPHGREAPRNLPRNPAWTAGRRRLR